MIVNVFSYSEPYEADLLEVKFNVEDSGVDKWVIVENEFDLRGKYKFSYTLNDLLNESRFYKFKHKVEVIETSFRKDMPDGIDDFSIINYQRDLQYIWVNKYCDGNDWVIISDLDEVVNFESKKEYIISNLYDNHTYTLVGDSYFLDFDNYNGLLYRTTILQKKKIISHYYNMNLQYIRHSNENGDYIEHSAFHFHNCMPKEAVWHKLNTYGHTNWTREMLDSMCKYNHAFCENERLYSGKYLNMKIELNESNTAKYVLNNLERLKTNNIDERYIQNRSNYAGF